MSLTESQRAAIAAAEAEIARIITTLSNEHRLIVEFVELTAGPDGVELVAWNAMEFDK
jgi:hypothetical protein